MIERKKEWQRQTWPENFSFYESSGFRKTNMRQTAMSSVVPALWNSLPEIMKKPESLDTFKNNVKNYCLNWINNELMKWVSHCYYFKDLAILTFSHYIYIFSTWNISFYFFHLSLMFSSLCRGTTMKIRHLCPFCAIPAIFIAIHISVTNNF